MTPRTSLIVPPMSVLPCPPWSLAYLAAALPRDSTEINLFDLNRTQWAASAIPWDEIEADVIGVSVNFSVHHSRYVCFLEEIRERFPSALVIVGGFHATGAPYLMSSLSCVDHVIVGSGEVFLNSMNETFAYPQARSRILSSKSINRVSELPPVDLDRLLRCSKELRVDEYNRLHLDYPAITYKGLPSRQVIFRRRCEFHCRHCVESITSDMVSDKTRVEDVVDYIALQNSGSSTPHCYFLDPTLNAREDLLAQLCEVMASRLTNTVWGCKARIELFNRNLVSAMADAGCRFVEVGVEALDDNTLTSLRRPCASDLLLDNLDLLTANGIAVQCNFLLGLPSDTLTVLESRITSAHRLMNSYNVLPCFWLFCPFPGSETWSQLGLAEDGLRWENLTTTPLAEYGRIRDQYSYLPSGISAEQMKELLQFAWTMPERLTEKWFVGNKLFQAAASEYRVPIDTLMTSLFPCRIGDFIHSRFFII